MTEDGGERHEQGPVSGEHAHRAEHGLIVEGTGFFSKGSCSACKWTGTGHPDDLSASWTREHGVPSVRVRQQRSRTPMTSLSANPTVRNLEHRMIAVLCTWATLESQPNLYLAWGMAEARAMLLGESLSSSQDFVLDVATRIKRMNPREREKLRNADRERQQEILEGS